MRGTLDIYAQYTPSGIGVKGARGWSVLPRGVPCRHCPRGRDPPRPGDAARRTSLRSGALERGAHRMAQVARAEGLPDEEVRLGDQTLLDGERARIAGDEEDADPGPDAHRLARECDPAHPWQHDVRDEQVD